MSNYTTISNINNRTAAIARSSNTIQSWKTTKAFDDVRTSRTAARSIMMTNESFFETISKKSVPGNKPASFETALLSADENPEAVETSSSAFGFEDVLDVINPLQHLPVINLVYRGLTGDTIKPMAQIIGGGLYGGPIGAISGTVNAVIQHETGHDIAGNVLALVRGEIGDGHKEKNIQFAQTKDDPEKQLELAVGYFDDKAQEIAKRDLPGTAMAFVNLKETAYDKRVVAEGRTAGHMNVRRRTNFNAAPISYPSIPITHETLPHLDTITRVEISPLPPENSF